MEKKDVLTQAKREALLKELLNSKLINKEAPISSVLDTVTSVSALTNEKVGGKSGETDLMVLFDTTKYFCVTP